MANKIFIKKDEKHMGQNLNIIQNEDELIEKGLYNKSIEELNIMAKTNKKYRKGMSKEELINILTYNLH